MIYRATVLLAGVAIAVSSLSYQSATVFLLGTALAGSGFCTGFRGAIRTVVPLAAPEERAGVPSVSLKHELRVMEPQGGGSIINLSPTMGSRGAPGASMYVASTRRAAAGARHARLCEALLTFADCSPDCSTFG